MWLDGATSLSERSWKVRGGGVGPQRIEDDGIGLVGTRASLLVRVVSKHPSSSTLGMSSEDGALFSSRVLRLGW